MLILGFLLKSQPFPFSKYVGVLKRKVGMGRVVWLSMCPSLWLWSFSCLLKVCVYGLWAFARLILCVYV